MKNKHKTMQDKRPADIVCSACSMILIPAQRVDGYRERDKQEIIERHKCTQAAQSKRDIEGEIR